MDSSSNWPYLWHKCCFSQTNSEDLYISTYLTSPIAPQPHRGEKGNEDESKTGMKKVEGYAGRIWCVTALVVPGGSDGHGCHGYQLAVLMKSVTCCTSRRRLGTICLGMKSFTYAHGKWHANQDERTKRKSATGNPLVKRNKYAHTQNYTNPLA